MMKPPVKVALLILAGYLQRLGKTSPTPPPTKNDKVNKGSWFDRNPRLVGYISGVSSSPPPWFFFVDVDLTDFWTW